MVFFDCIALICRGGHQLHICNILVFIELLSCWSVPGLSTPGVPQTDVSVDEMAGLCVGDAAQSMPSLLNVHEKADTILAYATVSGTATQLVRCANRTCKMCKLIHVRLTNTTCKTCKYNM